MSQIKPFANSAEVDALLAEVKTQKGVAIVRLLDDLRSSYLTAGTDYPVHGCDGYEPHLKGNDRDFYTSAFRDNYSKFGLVYKSWEAQAPAAETASNVLPVFETSYTLPVAGEYAIHRSATRPADGAVLTVESPGLIVEVLRSPMNIAGIIGDCLVAINGTDGQQIIPMNRALLSVHVPPVAAELAAIEVTEAAAAPAEPAEPAEPAKPTEYKVGDFVVPTGEVHMGNHHNDTMKRWESDGAVLEITSKDNSLQSPYECRDSAGIEYWYNALELRPATADEIAAR